MLLLLEGLQQDCLMVGLQSIQMMHHAIGNGSGRHLRLCRRQKDQDGGEERILTEWTRNHHHVEKVAECVCAVSRSVAVWSTGRFVRPIKMETLNGGKPVLDSAPSRLSTKRSKVIHLFKTIHPLASIMVTFLQGRLSDKYDEPERFGPVVVLSWIVVAPKGLVVPHACQFESFSEERGIHPCPSLLRCMHLHQGEEMGPDSGLVAEVCVSACRLGLPHRKLPHDSGTATGYFEPSGPLLLR